MKMAVFCGSSSGIHPHYTEATRTLGHFMAAQGIDLVYGGGKVGLMGCIADAVLEGGGQVHGVIPAPLMHKEIGHTGLTQLDVVADMHQRKARMAELADAFIALPGGIGTLEEIFEAWTWGQLGYHQKPCAFYNVQGFYDPLFEMIDQMSQSGFLKPEYASMTIRADQPEDLLEQINRWQPPKQKWS